MSLPARTRFARDHRLTQEGASEFIDAELDSGESDRIEHHMRDCPECRALIASLRTMVATLASLPGRPAESVADAVLLRVHERLGERDD